MIIHLKTATPPTGTVWLTAMSVKTGGPVSLAVWAGTESSWSSDSLAVWVGTAVSGTISGVTVSGASVY